jgi:hypothetical protein
MKWRMYSARMGEVRSVYKIVLEKPEGKTLLGDLDADGRKLLKYVFKEIFYENVG